MLGIRDHLKTLWFWLHIVQIIQFNILFVAAHPVHASLYTWVVTDIDDITLATHQVDEIFSKWVTQTMGWRAGIKAHEITGADLMLRVADFSNAASGKNI